MHRQSSIPWLLLLKLGILFLVTVFIWGAIQESRQEFAASEFSLRSIQWAWILVCAGSYLLGLLPMAVNWGRLMRAMGQNVPIPRAIAIHYLSQLGKYVPGKAFVMAIRLTLLRPFAVEIGPTILSMFADVLSMMSVGAVLGGILVAVQFRDRPEIALLAGGMAVCAGLPIMPPVLRLALRVIRRRRTPGGDEDVAANLTWSVVVPGWLGIVPGWCLLGLSMFAAMKALNLPETRDLAFAEIPWVTACYAISVVAGFLSMIPAGAGVREWVLQEMFEPRYGPVAALLAPLLHRMTCLVSELCLSGILYVAIRVRKREPSNGG